jgi:uncharacterized protein involved in exopolysaccharide biosynthesis
MQEGIDLKQIKGILRRRRKGFFLTFLPLLLAGSAVAFLLPPTFLSKATILIEGQQIPPEYVRTTITSYVEERLQIITQRIMSRGRLLEILNRFDLYADRKEKYTTEEILEQMRKDIKFKTISADVKDRRTGQSTVATIAFTLSYEGRNPGTVQKVANVLTSLYLEENLRTREQRASNTTEFLQQEIEGLRKQMDILQNSISEFKQRHMGDLPENTHVNLQMIARLNRDLDQVRMQINALKERKILLEGQIATVPPSTSFLTAEGKLATDPRERLKYLRLQLLSLQAGTSERHPDFIRLKREIEELERQVGETSEDDEREKRLLELNARLADARGTYGPKHPDVTRIEKEIELLSPEKGLADGGDGKSLSPKVSPPSPDGGRLVVKVENGRVRKAPSLESEVVFKLVPLEQVAVSDRRDPWYFIVLEDGRSGWAHQSLFWEEGVQSRQAAVLDEPGRGGNSWLDPKPDNPAYIHLKTQIESTDLEIGALMDQAVDVRKEILRYERRIEQTPVVEKEYVALLGDYENAKAKYNELTSKFLEAKVALGMEETQRGERFTIIDPAQLPERPHKPNRPAILVITLVLSLGAGIGLAAVREVADGSLKLADELNRFTGIPVLSVVPVMRSPEEKRAGRIRWIAAAFACIAVIAVGMMIMDRYVMPLEVFWAKVQRKAAKVSLM